MPVSCEGGSKLELRVNLWGEAVRARLGCRLGGTCPGDRG